ncbi:hypothetical protein MKX34_11875 [Paenibacillus sp. FSL R5-0636]|uniref:DUF4760 domain-containing protein n=1 Tax=Paenibacillus TaxID=44249 RepID=UPI00117FA3AC|nr:hypothetical protein [Paenibacillus odorifer]
MDYPWWIVLKDILGVLYSLSGIVLIIGVFVGIGQLKLLKKDLDIRNRRLAVETSLQYLNIYATEIIPEYEKYAREFKKEVPKPSTSDHLFDGSFNLSLDQFSKELLAESIIKQKLGLISIYNRYEFFATGILNKLTDEDLVFIPTGKDFCETIRNEHLVISLFRNLGTPYKNTIELYHKWQDRIDIEILELQKQEADAKIREKGDSYKSSPPIGF